MDTMFVLSEFRSQGFKEGKKKKMIETMERVKVGQAFKSGYQKIQNARMERKQTSEDSSESNSNKCKFSHLHWIYLHSTFSSLVSKYHFQHLNKHGSSF